MRKGTFDITSLKNAVERLGDVLVRYNNDPSDDAIRDSVIQRFEFTYSITLKTLRKYFIERAFIVDDVNQMSFNDMIRNASQLNLIKTNLEKWSEYREMRNMTSHTYDEKFALQVVSIIPKFYEEIKFLVDRLENNDD